MTRKYKRYTQEFKLAAIRQLNESDKPVVQLARELGIRVNQIYKWKKQLDEKSDKAFSRTQKRTKPAESMSDKDLEIKELKKRVERLEAEKTILKKAAAYFAKELD